MKAIADIRSFKTSKENFEGHKINAFVVQIRKSHNSDNRPSGIKFHFKLNQQEVRISQTTNMQLLCAVRHR